MTHRKKVGRRWTAHRLHQWMGLAAGLWLLVLGTTGFFLDHRDWRWLWQSGIDESWVSEAVLEKSREGFFRLYHIDIGSPDFHIVAGSTGMWWHDDLTDHWVATWFGNNDVPQIKSIVDDAMTAGKRKWLATDDGIWELSDNATRARPWALKSSFVNSLTQGSNANELLGVVDRSRVFRINTHSKKLDWINMQPLQAQDMLPEKIELNRFVRDLHFGRGVFSAPWSMLWGDATAIGMAILPVTGLFYWWLPRRWKRKRLQGKPVTKQHKQGSIRLLFRLHAPVLGVVTVVPILYLSITGIFLDHAEGLRDFMKSVTLSRSWQTPVYNYSAWENEIYNVVAYPQQPEKISIGTRTGLFTSEDGGQSWYREQLMPSKKANEKSAFIWIMKRVGNDLFIGGMGAPNFVKRGDSNWQIVKGAGRMPSDVTLDRQGRSWWMTQHGLKVAKEDSAGFENSSFPLPQQHAIQNYVPWYFVLDGLHSGLLIHQQWKWVNDVVSIMAVFLVVTGLIRWWRVKWL